MFIVGIDQRQDPVSRVEAARKQFDKLQRGNGEGGEVIEPDLIVVHNTHWTLLNMGSSGSITEDLQMAAGAILPQKFMREYIIQLKALSRSVRDAFPSVPVLMHTAAMVRHDVATGHTEGKRAWINRLFIDQLNQASRQVMSGRNLRGKAIHSIYPIQPCMDIIRSCLNYILDS